MEKQHGARGKHSNRKVLRGYIDFMMLSSANKSAPRLGLNKSWIIQECFMKYPKKFPTSARPGNCCNCLEDCGSNTWFAGSAA
jgi:hypothetical protein